MFSPFQAFHRLLPPNLSAIYEPNNEKYDMHHKVFSLLHRKFALLLSYNCVYKKQGNVSKWLLFTGPKLEDDFTLATKKLLTINKIEIINNPQKLAQVKKKDIRMTNWSVVLEVSSELFLKRLFCVSLRHVVKGFEMQTHFPILLFG